MDYSKIPGATYICFKKGEYLIRSGDTSNYFFLIMSGSCRRLKFTYKGDELIMANYAKNNIACAFMAYYDIPSASDIVATELCCCWKIPRNSFLEAMKHEQHLMKLLLEQIMQEYFDLSIRFRLMQEGQTPNLLCRFLLSHSHKDADGQLLIDKSFSNTVIANHLGIHKVTATRIINVLQKEDIISRTKDGLIIQNLEKLNDYIHNNKKMVY